MHDARRVARWCRPPPALIYSLYACVRLRSQRDMRAGGSIRGSTIRRIMKKVTKRYIARPTARDREGSRRRARAAPSASRAPRRGRRRSAPVAPVRRMRPGRRAPSRWGGGTARISRLVGSASELATVRRQQTEDTRVRTDGGSAAAGPIAGPGQSTQPRTDIRHGTQRHSTVLSRPTRTTATLSCLCSVWPVSAVAPLSRRLAWSCDVGGGLDARGLSSRDVVKWRKVKRAGDDIERQRAVEELLVRKGGGAEEGEPRAEVAVARACHVVASRRVVTRRVSAGGGYVRAWRAWAWGGGSAPVCARVRVRVCARAHRGMGRQT